MLAGAQPELVTHGRRLMALMRDAQLLPKEVQTYYSFSAAVMKKSKKPSIT